MDKVKTLLVEDQENITRFKAGEIDFEKFREKANEIADTFFSLYTTHGFPYRNNHTDDIYKGAVVLTLHQPIENIERIFSDIKDASEEKIDPKDLAFMEDKIRVNKGEKQVYGTQYKIHNDRVEFLPIENDADVDKRRKEIGLESLEEYREKAEKNMK